VKTLRSLARIICLLLLASDLCAQDAFDTKFFDNLTTLFGRLQQSELDTAFQDTKAVRCADLLDAEWKEVAFLNDDRSIAAWHYQAIGEVRDDLVRYVFSGTCPDNRSPLKLTTAYPVRESLEQVIAGKIPFAKVVVRENKSVKASFDRSTNSYKFQLPFLYLEKKLVGQSIYTLLPPTAASRPAADTAEEFRCKGVTDGDLIYRFLLCRTRLFATKGPPVNWNMGSFAYYILSDGKEASSSVKLTFGDSPSNAPAAPKKTSAKGGAQ
jgi:hypothetical protein